MLAKLTKPIWWIFHAWTILCFVAFFLGIIMPAGAPSRRLLPWSDFNDFIESSDGKVFIDIGFYNRVLCYDHQGKFLCSYPYPYGHTKDTELAASRDGRVFFRALQDIYVYDTAWNKLRKFTGMFPDERNWVLDDQGQPDLVIFPIKDKVVNSLAVPGDRIFASSSRRKKFECSDGSTLIREGNNLKRYDNNGTLLTVYAAPIYFWPFTFPWPAFLAWPYFFFYAYVAHRKKQLSKHSSDTNLEKNLFLDATFTLVVVLTVAAVYFTGLFLIIDINNAQTNDNLLRPLLAIVAIAWFFGVPFAGFKLWTAVQKRLAKPTGNAQDVTTLNQDSGASTLTSDSQSKILRGDGQQESAKDAY